MVPFLAIEQFRSESHRDSLKHGKASHWRFVKCKRHTSGEMIYQSPLLLTELFQHNLINVSYLTACYLYQVMMTLHFLNDVANDAE